MERRPQPLLLTPLIDLMFLITIFFVLTSGLNSEPTVAVDVPAVQDGQRERVGRPILAITPGPRFFAGEQELTLEEISAWALEERQAQAGDSLEIRADRRLAYETVMLAMERVRRGGWARLLLTVEGAGTE